MSRAEAIGGQGGRPRAVTIAGWIAIVSSALTTATLTLAIMGFIYLLAQGYGGTTPRGWDYVRAAVPGLVLLVFTTFVAVRALKRSRTGYRLLVAAAAVVSLFLLWGEISGLREGESPVAADLFYLLPPILCLILLLTPKARAWYRGPT